MRQNQQCYSHTVKVRTRPFSIFSILLLGLLVSACSSKRVVQTVDDSTEYKSARALPPLKKPSRVLTPATSPSPEPAVEEPVATEFEQLETLESSMQPEVSESQPSISPEITVDESVVEPTPEPLVDSAPVVTPETIPEPAPAVLSARVVRDDSDNSTLEIEAKFEQAWEYLTRSLQKSDVTVFARNKDAGRFSIGCAGVADDDATVRKKGGWSFFSRAKNEESEYCALQALERKGKTIVSVVDRSGIVVLAENSEKLFERILNN